MERKIGDTFEFDGKKLEVKAASRACDGCILEEKCCIDSAELLGTCGAGDRTDKKDVIFVEVQEQPQKTEEIKERKVGEVFDFEGHKLKVVDEGTCKCNECLFYRRECSLIRNVIGSCSEVHRTDKKSVIFVEVKDEQPHEEDEQPQDEQPQKLNLCEVLKYCPKDEQFWSPMLDGVKFSCIDEERQMIIVETVEGHFTWEINADGTISIDEVTSPEVMLYPSKEMRDWSKFTAPWLKKERFDPKTLKAFDKVLVKDNESLTWKINMFSHINNKAEYPYCCLLSFYKYCIPYNDETKHLVETRDEAPEYYRYWED